MSSSLASSSRVSGRNPGMLSMLKFTPGMPGGRVSGSLACSSRVPGAILEVTGGEGLRRLYKAQPFMWTGASYSSAGKF